MDLKSYLENLKYMILTFKDNKLINIQGLLDLIDNLPVEEKSMIRNVLNNENVNIIESKPKDSKEPIKYKKLVADNVISGHYGLIAIYISKPEYDKIIENRLNKRR